jgi:hypothetical protein
MCELATVAIIATAAAGGTQAYGQYQSGVAQNKMYQFQADQNRMEGNLAVTRGQKQSELIQDTASREGKRLKTDQAGFSASQRAAMAASGVTGVTAQDITSDSFSKQRLDELALRYNYDTKSYEVTEGAKYQKYALDTQADQLSLAGKNAKKAGKMNAFGTLLSTAASMAMMGMMAGGAGAGAKAGGGGLNNSAAGFKGGFGKVFPGVM